MFKKFLYFYGVYVFCTRIDAFISKAYEGVDCEGYANRKLKEIYNETPAKKGNVTTIRNQIGF